MWTWWSTSATIGPDSSRADAVTAPRFLFSSIAEARRITPFFIEEQGVGIWLSSDRTDLPAHLPVVLSDRDALHLPTVDRVGQALPESLIASFQHAAQEIGLTGTHPARGYWTLSGSGELQVERVWIAFSPEPVDPAALFRLAREVLVRGNQDAVACEIRGTVQVISGDVA